MFAATPSASGSSASLAARMVPPVISRNSSRSVSDHGSSSLTTSVVEKVLVRALRRKSGVWTSASSSQEAGEGSTNSKPPLAASAW